MTPFTPRPAAGRHLPPIASVSLLAGLAVLLAPGAAAGVLVSGPNAQDMQCLNSEGGCVHTTLCLGTKLHGGTEVNLLGGVYVEGGVDGVKVAYGGYSSRC